MPIHMRFHATSRRARRWALLISGVLTPLIVVMAVQVNLRAAANNGPPLTKQTWPAGTKISQFNRGGRNIVYHRGWLYLPGNEITSVWNIGDPTNPVKVEERAEGFNGHSYFKIGDMFRRAYETPELKGVTDTKYLDISDLPNRKPWRTPMPFPLTDDGAHTFPYAITFYYNGFHDMRTGKQLSNYVFYKETGIGGHGSSIIGNLMLMHAPGKGVAAFDVGDPAKPRLIDVLTGNFEQYVTEQHVYKHYYIIIGGKSVIDGKEYNAVGIDFSDPTNLRVAFKYTYAEMPGRYIQFQDEFGFVVGKKINMETGQTVQTLPNAIHDYYWLPLGHLVVNSSGDGEGKTAIYAHQNGLDTRPPTVAYHLPRNGATNQPVTTRIGMIIHETLDDVTVNSNNIIVRPVGGQPIKTVIAIRDNDIINIGPEETLQPNTTYEVEVVPGGVKDVSGNSITPYKFRFSTGSTLNCSSTMEQTSELQAALTVNSTVYLPLVSTGAASATPPCGGASPAPTTNLAVDIRPSTAKGDYLAVKGMSLYVFDQDSATTSACTGQCAITWPPLVLKAGETLTGPDQIKSQLGLFTRPDGSRQVTYKGRQLYYYQQDVAPGDTKGDGLGGVWHLAKP